MYNVASTRLDLIHSFLQVIRAAIKAWMGLKFSEIEHGSMELAALECLKKLHRHIMGVMLSASFLDGSSLFLQVSRTTIKALLSLIFRPHLTRNYS